MWRVERRALLRSRSMSSNRPSAHRESDVWQSNELIERCRTERSAFLLALDSFKAVQQETNLLNLTEGNVAVVPCDLPNGNPRPVPVFFFNQQPLVIDAASSTRKTAERDSDKALRSFSLHHLDRYKVLSNGNLHIIDIRQADSGKYRCSAQNPLTGQLVNNSQTTTLNVLNKPSNTKERLPLTTVYKPPVASR